MKVVSTVLLVLVTALALMLAPGAFGHNRAHVILPDGTCIVVGSEKSVALPENAEAPTNSDGFRDLRLETPADEIGTAFAADEGNSRRRPAPAFSPVLLLRTSGNPPSTVGAYVLTSRDALPVVAPEAGGLRRRTPSKPSRLHR